MRKVWTILIVVCMITLMLCCLVACDQPLHQHEFSTEWKTNAIEHWHECSCGEKHDLANHTDEDNDWVCDTCKFKDEDEFTQLNNDVIFTLIGNGTDAYYSIKAKNKDIQTLSIPSSVDGIPVKELESYAFSGCTVLTSIIIPDSVISIGDYAFKYCTGLTKITMTISVTSMGDYSLYECPSLKNITFDGDIEQYRSIEMGVAYDYNIHWQIIINCNNGKLDKRGDIITWEW